MRKNFAAPAPKALACALLEDGGRALFLKTVDASGAERLELPCVLIFPGADMVAELARVFREQTGIDGEVREIAFEARHNAGSRKKKRLIPCLVFRISAKNARGKHAARFSGFKWLPLAEAGKLKLARNAEWLARL